MKDLNRIKVVLVEKKRTSKWCTNTSQPDLQTLDRISELLNVDKRELLTSN